MQELACVRFYLLVRPAEDSKSGLVVFTDGIKLGGGVLPSKDGKADNDGMSIVWKSTTFGWILLVQTQLLPGNVQDCLESRGPAAYHLVNYHCISEHWKYLSPPRGGISVREAFTQFLIFS